MLKLYIREFLEKKGYKASPTSLRNIGLPQSAAYKIAEDRSKSIKLDHLEYLCKVFDCTPNDLFNFEPEDNDQLAPDHSLFRIARDEDKPSPLDIMKRLNPEEIDQAQQFLEELVRKRINNE